MSPGPWPLSAAGFSTFSPSQGCLHVGGSGEKGPGVVSAVPGAETDQRVDIWGQILAE